MFTYGPRASGLRWDFRGLIGSVAVAPKTWKMKIQVSVHLPSFQQPSKRIHPPRFHTSSEFFSFLLIGVLGRHTKSRKPGISLSQNCIRKTLRQSSLSEVQTAGGGCRIAFEAFLPSQRKVDAALPAKSSCPSNSPANPSDAFTIQGRATVTALPVKPSQTCEGASGVQLPSARCAAQNTNVQHSWSLICI